MPSHINAKQFIPFLDLTSLNHNDTTESISKLCQTAQTPAGPVAAVCILPQFISLAKTLLADTPIRIATVVNFPEGHADLDKCQQAISQAIHDGADEIDAVIPYKEFLAGNKRIIADYTNSYRHACPAGTILKIILETGAYPQMQQIGRATELAIKAGADFIKTSTGTIDTGASLNAVDVMLQTIKHHSVHSNVGIKVSGGVSTLEQAQQYWQHTVQWMGADWITPQTFRIGSSSLLTQLLES